jgi:hypothetical protein
MTSVSKPAASFRRRAAISMDKTVIREKGYF